MINTPATIIYTKKLKRFALLSSLVGFCAAFSIFAGILGISNSAIDNVYGNTFVTDPSFNNANWETTWSAVSTVTGNSVQFARDTIIGADGSSPTNSLRIVVPGNTSGQMSDIQISQNLTRPLSSSKWYLISFHAHYLPMSGRYLSPLPIKVQFTQGSTETAAFNTTLRNGFYQGTQNSPEALPDSHIYNFSHHFAAFKPSASGLTKLTFLLGPDGNSGGGHMLWLDNIHIYESDTMFNDEFTELKMDDVPSETNAPTWISFNPARINPANKWTLCKVSGDAQHQCLVSTSEYHTSSQLAVTTVGPTSSLLISIQLSTPPHPMSSSGSMGYYKAGHINSRWHFSFTHGYVEARVKLPPGEQGLFPAIWMVDSQTNWRSEIDLLEMLMGRGTTVYNTAHWDRMDTHHYSPDAPGRRNCGAQLTGSIANEWHIFGVNWSQNDIVWYLDGNEICRKRMSAEFKERINGPMYLLMGLSVNNVSWNVSPFGKPVWEGVGDYGPNELNTNGFPNVPRSMAVDYIRVYRTKDTLDNVQPSEASDFGRASRSARWDWTGSTTGAISVNYTDTTRCGSFMSTDYYESCGDNGLAVVNLTNQSNAYFQRDLEQNATNYRAKFIMRLNTPLTPTLAGTKRLPLWIGHDSSAAEVMRIELVQTGNLFSVCGVLSGASTSTCSATFNAVADRTIEFEWKTGTPGSLQLWLDGAAVANPSTTNNATRHLRTFRLGAIGIPAGSTGRYYIDTYRSYITPASVTPTPTPTPIPNTCNANMISNPTFANGTANWLNWGGTQQIVAGKDDASALQLNRDTATGGGGAGNGLIAVTPGRQYRLSFWGKVSGTSEVGSVGVYFNTGNSANTPQVTANTFTQYTLTFTPQAGNTSLYVYGWVQGTSGNMVVDQFCLTDITP